MISLWILRQLRAVPELQVVVPAQDTGSHPRVELGAGQGHTVPFELLEIRLVSEERARDLLETVRAAGVRVLIATTRLAPRTRTLLRDAGLSWLERDTGRCRLYAPGLLVDVVVHPDLDRVHETGRRARPRTAAPKLRDRSGLIAEALLLRTGEDRITLTELAETTRLSRGLVSRLFSRLTELGLLGVHGKGPHKTWLLSDPGALLDLWAAEERTTPEEVTGLSVWSRTPDELLDRLISLGAQFPYALGGAAAANLHAPTLTVTPQPDVWIPADIPAAELAKRLGGEVVESGANVRVLQSAGDVALLLAQTLPSKQPQGRGLSTVSPYRAYVQARATAGRGPEAADALRRTLPLAPRSGSGVSGAR